LMLILSALDPIRIIFISSFLSDGHRNWFRNIL
jgi:hypothetical protein